MFSIQTRTTAAFILLIYIKAASVPVFTHDVEIPPSFLTMPPREIIHIPGRPLHIPCKAIGFPEPREGKYSPVPSVNPTLSPTQTLPLTFNPTPKPGGGLNLNHPGIRRKSGKQIESDDVSCLTIAANSLQ
nr:unnamed protein product [Spirometra erinaceieuropaei]